MAKIFGRALIMLLVMTLLTGFIYPMAVTGLAQLLFADKANGSMIERDGKSLGSTLIGQNFNSPRYFHGRPSAAGNDGYDAAASSGSNLGPTNKVLIAQVFKQAEKVRVENELGQESAVPADLVTASASGLDPHISPEAALLQITRVARERQLSEQEVRRLVERHIESPQLGILGESRVNILLLNLELDKINR